ncbi:MAG: ribosomal RNA small subunit methyltransferase A [Planctomycetes bacterium RBG_16_55_9]|nr:MAG: ribosomal RNA small subunit methyltransferase A [Planctomycetes bacterium RBG_16_55_9]
MQTKRQIQQLLSSAGIRPSGRLGQHFLVDLNLMRLLVDSANIQKDDIVLEVGCGTGSLTQALAEKAGRTIAVELDRNLFEIAKTQLAKAENVGLINSDVLESKHTISRAVTEALTAVRESCPGRVLLVANLPYNVASPLMMNLVTGPTIADGMVVTVQKEVAERMTAKPGTGHYGTLSIFLGATGEVETIRILKPSVFWPRPQVDSAMVRFARKPARAAQVTDMERFSEMVHLFMGHRRKTLLACSKLARGELGKIADWPEIFEQCRIDPVKRPEQLSADDYVAITNYAINYEF